MSALYGTWFIPGIDHEIDGIRTNAVNFTSLVVERGSEYLVTPVEASDPDATSPPITVQPRLDGEDQGEQDSPPTQVNIASPTLTLDKSSAILGTLPAGGTEIIRVAVSLVSMTNAEELHYISVDVEDSDVGSWNDTITLPFYFIQDPATIDNAGDYAPSSIVDFQNRLDGDPAPGEPAVQSSHALRFIVQGVPLLHWRVHRRAILRRTDDLPCGRNPYVLTKGTRVVSFGA